VMFAAEPYETIAFKVPNVEVDKTADRFFAHWEPDKKVYTVQLHFKAPGGGGGAGGGTGGYALPGEGQAGGTGGYALPSTNMGNDARYGETGGVILGSMGSFAPPPPPPGRLPVGVAPPPGAFAPPPPPPPPQ
jgi:splicing factor 3A subunit 2